MMFDDRRDAGRRLAGRLERYRDAHPVVLALPRGGVPVGYEVARALDAPLDVLGVRKLGAPARLTLAVPVAPPDTLAPEVDEVMCRHTPAEFDAVGRFYCDFTQTSSDGEVVRLLDDARHAAAAARAAAIR